MSNKKLRDVPKDVVKERIAELLGLSYEEIVDRHKEAERIASFRKEDTRMGVIPFPTELPVEVQLTAMLIYLERTGDQRVAVQEHAHYIFERASLSPEVSQRVLNRLQARPELPPRFIRLGEAISSRSSSSSGSYAAVH